MPTGKNKVRIALGALLVVLLAFAGYWVGMRLWAWHHFAAAQQAAAQRDFPQARLQLEKCLEITPGDREARFLLAQACRREGSYDEARKHLRIAARDHYPEQAVNLEHRLLNFLLKDVKGFDKLLASCAEHPQAAETPLILEAVIESLLNEMLPPYALVSPTSQIAVPAVEAKLYQAIDQWLALRPSVADQVQGLVWRGRLLRLARDHANAVSTFRQALDLDPQNFQARLQLTLEVALSSPQEALTHLRVLCRQQPKNVRVRYILANTCRRVGQLAEAQEIADEILKESPDDVSVLIERGNIAIDRDRIAESEPYFRRAVALAPREADPNSALSRCLQQLGKTEEAKYYRKIFQQLDAEREKAHKESP